MSLISFDSSGFRLSLSSPTVLHPASVTVCVCVYVSVGIGQRPYTYKLFIIAVVVVVRRLHLIFNLLSFIIIRFGARPFSPFTKIHKLLIISIGCVCVPWPASSSASVRACVCVHAVNDTLNNFDSSEISDATQIRQKR